MKECYNIFYMKIILGSSSKPRKSVLEENGYTFEIMSPDIDEKAVRIENHYDLPLLLARAKGEAIIPKISGPALVITADQVVVCNGDLYEKPQDAEEVKKYFKKYSDGFPAETVSALSVFNTVNGKQAEGVDITKVYFKSSIFDVAEDFITNGDPFSHAGGFAAESPILKPHIERCEGASDSTKGMPLKLLERLFKEVQ